MRRAQAVKRFAACAMCVMICIALIVNLKIITS